MVRGAVTGVSPRRRLSEDSCQHQMAINRRPTRIAARFWRLYLRADEVEGLVNIETLVQRQRRGLARL